MDKQKNDTIKERYLLILFLICIVPLWKINILLPIINAQNNIYLIALWMIYGYRKFTKSNPYWYKENRFFMRSYFLFTMIGLLSSWVTVWLEYGQDIVWSIWTYKEIVVSYLMIPLFLIVKPSMEEIARTCMKFSYIYMIVFVVCIFYPHLTQLSYDAEGEMLELAEGDFGYAMSGCSLITIPLYYYLTSLTKHKINKLDWIRLLFLIVSLFLIQTRSYFFVPLAFIGWHLIRKGHFLIRVLVVMICTLFFMIPSLNPVSNLIEETQEELDESDANRNLAWVYFSEADFSESLYTITGRGFVSTRFYNQVEEFKGLGEEGIFPSDVGFLGFIYSLGIIPVLVIFIMILNVLVKKRFPDYLRYWGIHILMGGATVSYFIKYEPGLWLFLFYYTFSLYYRTPTKSISNS